MNICIINGSHRIDGNCWMFSSEAKKIFEKKHTVKVFNLIDCNIIPCNGCLSCEEAMDCPLIDSYSEQIYPALMASDLIVFASPTYFNMPSALLVNFLDRTNNLCEYFSQNPKKVLTYLVGQTDENTIMDAYKCLKTYYEIMNMEEITAPFIRIARMPEPIEKGVVVKLKNIV